MNLSFVFWAVAEHHAAALRPIAEKMGKPVTVDKPSPNGNMVSSSAIEAAKNAQRTVYHFHSVSPYHALPHEPDYKHVPDFKAVMFPGEWWTKQWRKMPEEYAVVGWPKNDVIQNSAYRKDTSERAVLYASSMHDLLRMQTLKTLVGLSGKLGFRLLFKPHGGTVMWYRSQYEAMREYAKKNGATVLKSDANLNSFFPLADVLVSECSGALWEFLTSKKPSVQMSHAPRFARPLFAGVLHASFASLKTVLRRCFDNPRLCWNPKFIESRIGPLDGQSTERAVEFIRRVWS